MRLLLDTHAFLWWLADDSRLPAFAYSVIHDMDNEIFVSAASAWEITTKHRIGKLPNVALLAQDVSWFIVDAGFHELPITVQDAAVSGGLHGPHRDPFDRMLIAQALMRDMALVSNEARFDDYGVSRVWS